MELDFYDGVLILKEVSRADSGVYECHSLNMDAPDQEEVVESMQLTVHCELFRLFSIHFTANILCISLLIVCIKGIVYFKILSLVCRLYVVFIVKMLATASVTIDE